MKSPRHILFALSAMCIAVLAGCSSPSSGPPTVDARALEARAARELELGNTAAAISAYRQLAETSRGSIRAGYLLEAAGLAIDTGAFAQAQTWLEEARASASEDQMQTLLVLLARSQVGLDQPDAALATLASLRTPYSIEISRSAAEVRGRALFALGRPIDAVRTLVDREVWLDSAEAIRGNQRLIWDGLATVRLPPAPTGDPIVDGWLALAPLTALERDAAAFRRSLIEWRRRFATHPAASGVLAELMAGQRLEDGPGRIALLLPLSSARRTQALAVRDGFLAAHLSGERPDDRSITIYDTAVRGAADAYLAAQLEGADFIVGPLLPEEVTGIVDQTGFVPTLALNFAQQEAIEFPAGLYQFALSPEDEARAIAARAIAAGQTRALALFASDDRGYRLVNAFRDSFEALGGQVLNATAYVPESQNFSQPVAELLNRVFSEQRHRRLQANLGRAVEFEPRRRQDVDMIFLQALPTLGRLLAPQLRFHDAGDVPTYATSEIYDTARGGSESDLNGVMFPDLPLLLTPDGTTAELARELEAHWPQRARQWIRLYGFGYDAYHLMEQLYSGTPEVWPMAGITGQLDLDFDRRIRRALPFAQFQGGRPVALPSLPDPVAPLSPPPVPPANVFGAR